MRVFSRPTQWVATLTCMILFLGAAYCRGAVDEDKTLLIHYAFDTDPGQTAKDLSTYGHDGKIVKAVYLDAFDGRRGVLRFDGKASWIECAGTEALRIEGDMTFEMWVRLNGPRTTRSATVFGEEGLASFLFQFAHYQSLVLYQRGDSPLYGIEGMVYPVDRDLLGDAWSDAGDTWRHVAVVVEYPRCRFYRDGKLVRDAYMPAPGIAKLKNNPRKFIAGRKADTCCPMDLDEFRLYRRALSAEEIAAHARGEEASSASSAELAVEPNWYDNTVTLRLNCKGMKLAGHQAELALQKGNYTAGVAPRKIRLETGPTRRGRYVATTTFPLADLAGQSLDAVARIEGPGAKLVKTVFRHVDLTAPDWVGTKEGMRDVVLPPWTALTTDRGAEGSVKVGVWGADLRVRLIAVLQPDDHAGIGRVECADPSGRASRWA